MVTRRTFLKQMAALAAALPFSGMHVGTRTARAALTARQLAGQRVIYSYPGADVPQALLDAIAAGEIGGVIFFSENVVDLDQIAVRALGQDSHPHVRHAGVELTSPREVADSLAAAHVTARIPALSAPVRSHPFCTYVSRPSGRTSESVTCRSVSTALDRSHRSTLLGPTIMTSSSSGGVA